MVYKELKKDLSRRNFLSIFGKILAGSLFYKTNLITEELEFLKISHTAFVMGSILTIDIFHRDKRLADEVIKKLLKEASIIENIMNVFDEFSQISVVNKYSHKRPVHVDFRLIEVIKEAQRINRMTSGKFDITLEPLMRLFGFREESTHEIFVSESTIKKYLNSVGMEHIIINEENNLIALDNPRTKIDICGIAIGYYLDRCAKILKSNGITSAILNHSGDIITIGSPPDNDHWWIGITDPENPELIIDTIKIKDEAVATSGYYRNFRIINGKTVGHILDPTTGFADNSIASISIISKSALIADALSTAAINFKYFAEPDSNNIFKNIKYFAFNKDRKIIKNFFDN